MKNFAYVLLGLLTGALAFGGYLGFVRPTEAQRAARQQFEYASITRAYAFTPTMDRTNKIFGMADICYLQNDGCRRTEVRYELDYGAFLQDAVQTESMQARKAASQRAAETAFQKAMVQLGNDGWEVVSDPRMEIGFISLDYYNRFEDKSYLFERSDVKAVYFKRVRVQ